jgi:NADH-quinone oxidoreductase subunit M
MPYLLSVVIFLPLVGMLAVLALDGKAARATALVTTLVTFVVSLGLWMGFDPGVLEGQMTETFAWFGDSIDIKYAIGVDGLNLLLILLTTFLGPIVVLGSWTYIGKHHKGYYALLLLLQTGVTGVFASYDVILFYVFFELTLIPMYFIIGIWGGENRIYASVKFVVYTLVGSLLMLAAIFWLGLAAGDAVNGGVFTSDYFKLVSYDLPLGSQTWLFFLFALAFSIKVPLFPLHTWLPDAHVQAPTGGSVVLAGVLLKMGTYGLMRFCLPFFPVAAQQWAWLFAVLAVIGIIYGALISRVQTDAKKLVAYSSVSHLGFVVLGLFAFTTEALQGSLIQMINHGLSTGALFLLVGFLYERRHSRLMADYGGLAKVMPIATFFMVFSVMASAGLPGLNGFVGEFMILLGTYKSDVIGSPILVAFATTGVILAALYLLWMLYATFYGPVKHAEVGEMRDLGGRELAAIVPLAAFMLILGFFPAPFLKQSEAAVVQLLDVVEAKRETALRLAGQWDEADETETVTVDGAGTPVQARAALTPIAR